MKPRLIVIGPLPPPYHGVTVSTSLVLANQVLKDRFEVEHVDTSDHRAGGIGVWDPTNVALALRSAGALLRHLRGRRGTVYLPLSQNVQGFFRDSLFIHAAATAKWRVAAHLRGGEFDTFHEKQHRALRRGIAFTLSRIDSLAVMGESLRSMFAGLVPAERIKVVPNGTPEPDLDGAKRDANTVLFLSNLRRRKGIVEALQAALLVLRDEPSARFLFAGEWEDEQLEQRLRTMSRGKDGIHFLPAVADAEKNRLLASASVFLFPPVEPEGHPRVVLEALAAALPVVTTNRGAIAETVTDGETGFVMREPLPQDLADRLLRLLRDGDLRNRMSLAARASYLQRFTQNEADRRLADWLQETAGVASESISPRAMTSYERR
jgi:glycosyltransferase involved in cell wall biosynthesis